MMMMMTTAAVVATTTMMVMMIMAMMMSANDETIHGTGHHTISLQSVFLPHITLTIPLFITVSGRSRDRIQTESNQ